MSNEEHNASTTGAAAAADRKDKKEKAAHKATYARDKRKGGYLIRVQGPKCDRFAGREVPVTTMGGAVHDEELDSLVWSGNDKESGERVALYTFVAKPREEEEVEF